MSWKTINPTIEFHEYMALQYRYMRFICSIKKISMLDAIEKFGYRYKILYSKKIKFTSRQLKRI
jgi:hypothetical protein